MRRTVLEKTLATLEKSLKKLEHKQFTDYQELRDSITQRFKYSADTFWKYLKDYLRVSLSIEVEFARPKAVLKACNETNIISQEEELDLCIDLIEDRNLTSHGYNESTAENICGHIPRYFALMNKILQRTKI